MANGEEPLHDVATHALENLVGQFSSKYDCFRELVQNSIDAGSQLIEVWTEFESDGRGAGTATLHVDDDGEGMNRSIIDGQLTKLFSSRKEGDLTKIGKFGIGFVSIFALEPEAVILHTGRGGEYWEVFFHADRSFQLKELETPTEGTQVAMFLKVSEAGYQEMVSEIRSTLIHWCAHSETEILFEDRSGDAPGGSINQAFEVEGELLTRFEVPGTEIVAAYHSNPVYGFYNRGLALYFGSDGLSVLENRADRYSHISFKVKSRYLEHTLSRETVVKDENYRKAMQLLDDVVDGALLDALVESLEALAGKQRSVEEEDQYRRYCGYLAYEPAASFKGLLERRILCAHHTSPKSPHEALEAVGYSGKIARPIFATEEASAVTENAAQWVTTFAVSPVSQTRASGPTALLLKCLDAAHQEREGGMIGRLFGRKQHAPHKLLDPKDAFFVVEQIGGDALQQALRENALGKLRRLGLNRTELIWVRLSAQSPPASPPELVSFRTDDVAEPLDIAQSVAGQRVGIVQSHDFILKLRKLAERCLEDAALMLAQRIVLSNVDDEPAALGLTELLTPEFLNG